jgi:hypothetical protein
MAPSRQERRKAERAAAKRAPAKAGAAGSAGAAAARANAPGGDWTTQHENPAAMLQAHGVEAVEQMADEAGVRPSDPDDDADIHTNVGVRGACSACSYN